MPSAYVRCQLYMSFFKNMLASLTIRLCVTTFFVHITHTILVEISCCIVKISTRTCWNASDAYLTMNESYYEYSTLLCWVAGLLANFGLSHFC